MIYMIYIYITYCKYCKTNPPTNQFRQLGQCTKTRYPKRGHRIAMPRSRLPGSQTRIQDYHFNLSQ